jgi:hypothetical protein
MHGRLASAQRGLLLGLVWAALGGSAFAQETPPPPDVAPQAAPTPPTGAEPQATPTATPAAPPSTDASSGTHFTPSVEAGFGYQNIFGISTLGIAPSVSVAWEFSRMFRFGLSLGADFGWTPAGLKTSTVAGGPLFELVFGRVGFGVGGRVGTFNVGRVTTQNAMLVAIAGLYGRVTVDLVRWEHGMRLYLYGQGGVDATGGPLFGASGGVGFRL